MQQKDFKMKKDTTRTYETRVHMQPNIDEGLRIFANYFAKVEHCLFADIAAGKKAKDLKNDYLKRYQITARHFNAIRVLVEGKMDSIKVRRSSLILEKKDRIASLEKKIQRLIKSKAHKMILHQKKRRLHQLKQAFEALKQDHKQDVIRLCFGSKKLFRAQFDLEANGYDSHKEWLEDWRTARTRELFFLGSKDETSGNQTCTATVKADQTLSLRIRLPDSLFCKFGKYLTLDNIRFNYGQQEILEVLGKDDQALSWRLLCDDKGWRVFVTLDITPPVSTSDVKLGVVGLDINRDHLAFVEIDRFGNPIYTQTIALHFQGKSSQQIKALIGDAVKEVIDYVKTTGKPLILEDLDFQTKKAILREESSKAIAKMLSSFAYQSIISHLKSNALKQGVLVKQVNPAYTSLIGRVKFADRYGLTLHHAAALVIGRRFLGYSENPPSAMDKIPDGKSGHVTLVLPVRNRTKHVGSFWKEISKKFSAALKAHFRAAKRRSSSTIKPAHEMKPSKDTGETPVCESSELLFA